MSLSVANFFKNLSFMEDEKIDIKRKVFNKNTAGEYAELQVTSLAFYSCVNIIANAINKCEFKVYNNNKETKNSDWYTWNVEPNNNQNAKEFICKLITVLYENNEALVVNHKNQLFVADAYQVLEDDLKGDSYFNVQIEQTIIPKTFRQKDVLHFKLNDEDINEIANSLSNAYSHLLTTAVRTYTDNNSKKYTLDISTQARNDLEFDDIFSEMVNEDLKTFLNNPSGVLPVYEGFELNELGSTNNGNSRDIKSLFDDIIDFYARAFNIPPSLIKGDVQDTTSALDTLLTLCIDPLCELISNEINRKIFGTTMLNGNFIKIDTKAIKHIDLLTVATSIDKLISSGCFCVNDIRRVCKEEEIDEDWANQYFMTKNYSTVDELLETLKKEENYEK